MTNLAKLAVLALVLSAMGGLAVAQTAPVVPTIVTPANNSNHTVNQQVTFEGSATGGEAPYSYAWDFGDGSNGLGRIFEKTYTSIGERTVKLIVTDFAGRIAETTILVNITSGGNPNPGTLVPTVVRPSNNSSHNVNQEIEFEASATGGEAPYSYAWDFGDGSNGLGRIFEKTYTSTGNRTVELTVTDFAGRIAETSIQVSITSGGGPGPSAPTISNVRVTDITQTSVIVRWETNIPADSRVIYDTVSHPNLGTEPNFGYANSTGTSNTDPKVTEHAVQISGLSANTTYYFRALSRS